jgi:hypothetical protein
MRAERVVSFAPTSTAELAMDNLQQFQAIRRYYRHLRRIGRAVELEAAGREWIARFARLWREHRNRNLVA